MSVTNPLPRRSLLLVLVPVLLAGSGSVLWRAARSKAPAAAAPAPVRVTTARVQQRDVPIVRVGVGTVTPAATVTVRTQIDGRLERIGFTEGEDVRAGQVLALIDPSPQQAALAQARAQKARDQAQLANARLDLERYTTLFAQEAATQQQLDTQRALVAQLEATVQVDDAQIESTRVQLRYTTIAAPIGGRVGARLVDVGNIVHASDPAGLVVINQVDPITVVFTLPEASFQDVNRALHESKEPLDVLVYARGRDESLARGKLVLLNNQIDTASGTVQLKARLANPGHGLWPGEYVDARLVLGLRRGALTVAASAVQRGPDGLYVYAVGAGDVVQAQPVEVAQIQDGIAIVDRGLSAGQRVVVDGQSKLKPGLSVVEAAAKAASTAERGAGR